MIRWLAGLSSLGVIGAATHLNVMHVGGYGEDASILIIAIAVLLAFGSAFIASAFEDGRWVSATLALLCLGGGEVYWTMTNAERELAQRERAEAPIAALAQSRSEAARRVETAEASKRAADAAMITEAAKPGCKKNCADLLKSRQTDAANELTIARAAMAALPSPQSVAPLPERLGVAVWAYDLGMAALRSVTIIGASLLLAMALGKKRTRVEVVEVKESVDEKKNIGAVSRFLRERIRPQEGDTVSIADLMSAYVAWCKSEQLEPLQNADLAKELKRIFDKIGVETETQGSKVRALEVRLLH